MAVTLKLKKRDLKVYPHSDTLPSVRPHLLIVPLASGAIFLQTTTVGLDNEAGRLLGSVKVLLGLSLLHELYQELRFL